MADLNEEKLAQAAEKAADVVVSNILRRVQGRQLREYRPKVFPKVISLGKYDGIFLYRGWTLCGFIPAMMKEFIEWKVMVAYRYRAPASFWSH